MDRSTCLLWLDTEFSTDDLDHASLLQCALVVTDEALAPIVPAPFDHPLAEGERRAHGLTLYVRPPDDAVISDFVRAQPELLERARSRGRSLDDVDRLLAAWIDAAIGPAGALKERPTIAGNSVHMDWFLARRDLREVARRAHYRLLDVTAFKIEWKRLGGAKLDKTPAEVARWFAHADLARGEEKHDAYFDVQASIAELAYYRAEMLRR